MNDRIKKNRMKRANILNQARRLFWQKGYAGTSIKDIASICNCLPGNIYNYFSSKENLLYEIIVDEILILLSSIKKIGVDEINSPVEQLRALIKEQVNVTLRHVKTPDILFETELRHLSKTKQKEILDLRAEYTNILQKVIQRGIDADIFSKIDVKIISFNIIAMIVRSRLWYSPQGELSPDEIADSIFNLVLHGIKKDNSVST